MEKGLSTAFIVPYKFIPPVNGGHQAAYGFSSFLAKKIPLTVITTSEKAVAELPFEIQHILPEGFVKYLSPQTVWLCYHEFRKRQVQRCITHQPFIALILLPVFWLLGIRFEIFVQNIEFQRFRSIGRWWWPLVYAIEWLLFRLANRLLFISPDDELEAKKVFGIGEEKCLTVHYGTRHVQSPPGTEKARYLIREKHGFTEDEFLIIFFGAYTYSPNLKAFELILNEISPRMEHQVDFKYKFLFCGSGMPSKYVSDHRLEQLNINYLGFVEDIDQYIQASDVMLNPINTGGGVKTKAIDSMALGKTVVSSKSGARGIVRSVCGKKLIVVEDYDFEAYVRELIEVKKNNTSTDTPASFFDFYHWGNTLKEV